MGRSKISILLKGRRRNYSDTVILGKAAIERANCSTARRQNQLPCSHLPWQVILIDAWVGQSDALVEFAWFDKSCLPRYRASFPPSGDYHRSLSLASMRHLGRDANKKERIYRNETSRNFGWP